MSTYRVIGPPGTGKTTFLARQARLAADKHGASNVVAVSLTKTAAAEIAGRDTPLPDENVGTLHAHCHRALDAPDLAETGTSMREFRADKEWLDDNGRSDDDDIGRTPPLHAAVCNHRARMTPEAQWSPDERDHWQAWQDYKRQTGKVDFTDLIEQCLRERIGPVADPRVLLLDEAQDFSALELALAGQWSQATDTTVIVGDTQQALYTWRGSDPDALDSMAVAGQRVLDQSYRCPRAVHEAATRWVSQLSGPEVGWKPRDASGVVAGAPFALRDTAATVARAQQLVADDTTMILATCRYMLAPLLAQLREQGVPFHNPWRADETAWNPLRGPGARALLALLRPCADTWREQTRMWTWNDLHAFTEPLQATTLARGSKAAIKAHCMEDQFGQTHGGETVDLGTLGRLLGDENADHPLLEIDRNPKAAVAWWERSLLARGLKTAAYPLAVWRAHGGLALLDTPRLTVGTVHSVKGGEAAHVVLAPELSKDAYYQAWLAGGRGHDAIIRMMYVALTRARETVTILEPGCPEYAPVEDVLREVIR